RANARRVRALAEPSRRLLGAPGPRERRRRADIRRPAVGWDLGRTVLHRHHPGAVAPGTIGRAVTLSQIPTLTLPASGEVSKDAVSQRTGLRCLLGNGHEPGGRL